MKRFLFFSLCIIFFMADPVFAIDRYSYESILSEFSQPGNNQHYNKNTGEKIDINISGPVSIGRAIGIALLNNPDIDMTIERVRQSEAMIDETLALFLPTISAYGEYVQGDAPSAYLFKTIDQRDLPVGIDFNRPGWFENYETGVRGRINLFNGGKDLLRKRMAETGLEISELDRRAVENALVASVIKAYYNVLAAGEYTAIAEESVKTVGRQLGIMKIRFNAGGALKSDLLSLEVRLAQAKEDLVRAKNGHDLTLSGFANLLGYDPDTRINLKNDEKVPGKYPQDYKSGLAHALANRPELLKTRKQIIQSRMSLEEARRQYLPRLDAEARYYLDDSGFDFERSRENWTAGIVLKWDLFAGMSRPAGVKKARGLLQEMLAADRKAVLSIQLDLKTAYLKLNEAKARLEVSKASTAQAQESLRLVKKQYEGGSSSITRYLDAELARNRSRINAAASFHDKQKAVADVGRALGYWSIHAREVNERYGR